MPENSFYYFQFGRKAARLSASFPGLGQLYNKQYFKGCVVMSIFTFAVALAFLLSSGPKVEGWLMLLLLGIPPLVWALSIYDAYHVGVEQRQRDAKRFNVQLVTVIRGYDIDNNGFEEVTMTKNVSRTGACLLLSRAMNNGSQVSLEFEGRERVRGRVVWAKETGNIHEHLVGMELLTPLTQFD
jgi:TM2 domain-containing membrane protein YozV